MRLDEVRLKRLVSGLAWRRTVHHHRPEVLATLVADIAATGPDHIAVTGDLINFSTEAEYAAASDLLGTLGPTADVTVSPGNHDALVGPPNPARFAPWRTWLGDEGDGFPFMRRRGPAAILNLCSAIPTPVHLAQGQLGADQIARLEAELTAARQAGLCRIVLIHHPVADGVVADRKALTDRPALQAMLAHAGAELILHGHAHRSTVSSVAGPDGPIPALGVPSASMSPGQGEAARWHEIAITPCETGFDIDIAARGIQPDGTMASLGGYRLATGIKGEIR